MKSFSTGVVPFALILGVVTVLMLLEPHLSGTLLILSIGAVLMFVGGRGCSGWAGRGLGAAAIAAAVIALPELVPYATDRLASWRDPFADPLGEGHQTIQSLYAIASGRAGWVGAGQQPTEISVRAGAAERLYFFRFCVRSLVLSGRRWSWRCFCCCSCAACRLRWRARDKFGALLVVGFVVQVTLQAI